jgi:hypothetical protein
MVENTASNINYTRFKKYELVVYWSLWYNQVFIICFIFIISLLVIY